MTALYRTYRPRTFDDVVGQEAVVRTLCNAIAHDQVRQAYIFSGPRGTGKTSIARILAKALNAEGAPRVDFDPDSRIARAIADGTSLDVIEMDAASQRGIDDIREIRERVVLQPAEGRYKVYILDEAHQLTKDAWSALLKLIEEPPPHLVFIFCTTDLAAVLQTVRSRCQTFVFQRPRLQQLVTALRLVTHGEGIDVPDSALALIARGAHGSFRDAISTLDQLAAATENRITVQDVLQLVGAVEEDSLFRLCDMVVDRDTAGALAHVEELAEQGQDIGRLVGDLTEHLRCLLLVQHLGYVPESLPVTEETRERMREQANQLPEPMVLRMLDLLHAAIDDQRQGGDPRLPLELALVKVTRPHGDLSRESLAYRVEMLEARSHAGPSVEARAPSPVPAPAAGPAPESPPPTPEVAVADAKSTEPMTGAPAPAVSPAPGPAHALELGQLQEAWMRSILPSIQERNIPVGMLLTGASPSRLDGDTLTLEFAPEADFHRKQMEEERNIAVLRDALYEVTGRKLAVVTVLGARVPLPGGGEETELTEESWISLLKDTFDATEVEEMP